MEFKNINQLCRVCLQGNKQTFDIYTSYYTKKDVLYCEMLSSCTKIKPSTDDGLPRLICKDCCRQLRRSYVFSLLCEESVKRLSEFIKKRFTFNVDVEVKAEDEENTQNSTINDLKVDTGNTSADEALVNDGDKTNTDVEDDQKSNLDILNDTDNIKLESTSNDNTADDSCWDDDDNAFLGEIKMQKNEEQNIEVQKPKKKPGRKKKVYLSDEPQLPKSKLPHQCDVCGKVLSTKSNMNAHKICHTDLRPYKCTSCPATFRGHSALFQHNKVHTKETPYHCEYCSKQFSRRTGLVNHIRIHMGEKQYSCDICFKNFVQNAQLSIHMKRHKGDKTFLCQECGKGFPIRADLKVHQRTHNGEKPYACHLCTKTFATSGNLNIHIRIHNKEIRYNCKVCFRGFVTRSAYNVHVKRHKGQRDYLCECGKTFYTSSALKQHKVVHTGEKRYQCKICERKFTQTSHLSRHVKRDHIKPNAPLPTSEQYKTVLPKSFKSINFFDGNTENSQKVEPVNGEEN